MIADLLIKFLLKRAHGQPRVVTTRDGKHPYLTRYFLTSSSKWSEGMEVAGLNISTPKWGLYLHHFHRGDDGAELHNHPWKWAVSLILKGGYSEERRTFDGRVVRRDVLPGTLNFLNGDDFHRADLRPHWASQLREDGAWTLFLVGPIVQSWGFWDRDTRIFTPWRRFLGLE